jgi:hypothetical protein
MTIIEFMNKWESIWLFTILVVETYIGFLTLSWVKREYFYDKDKDERRQKRTKTSKKTTTNPGGASVIEESVEVSEPISDSTKGESK